MNTGYPFTGIAGQMPAIPFYPQQTTFQQPLPQMEIPKVNGEESARAFPIGANSSVLLMDTDPNRTRIWMIVTDASGFKTITPLKAEIDVDEKPVTTATLEEKLLSINDRLNRIEERMGGNEPVAKPVE
jgi:hypothetical protein